MLRLRFAASIGIACVAVNCGRTLSSSTKDDPPDASLAPAGGGDGGADSGGDAGADSGGRECTARHALCDDFDEGPRDLGPTNRAGGEATVDDIDAVTKPRSALFRVPEQPAGV